MLKYVSTVNQIQSQYQSCDHVLFLTLNGAVDVAEALAGTLAAAGTAADPTTLTHRSLRSHQQHQAELQCPSLCCVLDPGSSSHMIRSGWSKGPLLRHSACRTLAACEGQGLS
jgi:hypothetical protein